MTRQPAKLDRIRLEGMEFHGYIGVSGAERDILTRVTVDVELRLDLTKAGVTDALVNTLDYSTIHSQLAGVVEGQTFALLEALGSRLVATLLVHEQLDSVEVRVAKRPPLAGHINAAVVIIERYREPQP